MTANRSSGVVWITDYITDPDIETAVLGELLSPTPHDKIEVLLVWHERIDRSVLNRFPHLKGVVRYGVGYDNLDMDELSQRKVVACNTPDYGIDEVADTAVAMILNIVRGVSRYDERSRRHTTDWQENTIHDLRRTSECVVGVVGAGRIGGSVLLKLKHLGFQTLFFDPYKPSGHEKMLASGRVHDLSELLAQSDIVSIHTPLTPETRGMVNAAFLASMKRGASLVNTARGPIVAELDALYEALASGQMASVALDVLPEEPPVPGRLIDAWRAGDPPVAGRVIINPHTAYYSRTAYREMREKAALNAKRIVRRQPALNVLP